LQYLVSSWQLLNCLKASDTRVGLLFNFGRPKLEFRVTVYHTAFYEPQRHKERQGSQRLYPFEMTICVSLSPSSIPQDRLRVFVVNDYNFEGYFSNHVRPC